MAIEPALVHLLIENSYGLRATVPAVDGQDLAAKPRAVDPWPAFAMINYWPAHDIREEKLEAPNPDDPDDVEWRFEVSRDGDDMAWNPVVRFDSLISWEQAVRTVAELQEHYLAHMAPDDLAGLDLFDRMQAVTKHRRGHLAAAKALEKERAAKEELERERQARAVARNDPASDFNRAERSVRAGRNFTLTRYTSGKDREFQSSMAKALAILADPDTKLHHFEELDRGDPEGEVQAIFYYSQRSKGFDGATHHMEFWAPSLAELDRRALDAATGPAAQPPVEWHQRSGVL